VLKKQMTHIHEVEVSHYKQLTDGTKNFLLLKAGKKIAEEDTIILQCQEGEYPTIVTGITIPDENNGLKSGWQALTIKPKEA